MIEPTGAVPSENRWEREQRRWALGWRRVVFGGVFLAYLVEVVGALVQHDGPWGEAVGSLLLAAFCAIYLAFLALDVFTVRAATFWGLFLLEVALFAAELPLARGAAFVMTVFLVVLAVARLGARALPIVVASTVAAVLVPPAVPAWHQDLQTSVSDGIVFAIPMTALAMFVFFSVIRANRALAEARSELARLAAENERIRIARDLHDLLGHSLTTIIVKAELARRLLATDTPAAAEEVAEVETLTRRALAEVRSAISGYRERTVAGELATGRELLRAAGITADLPQAVDVVDERARELFAWVLREGLTNVVRHSHATTCRVTITPDCVEIVDDGVGGPFVEGSGLRGLDERVRAAGGHIEHGPTEPKGWRLRVRLTSDGAPPDGRRIATTSRAR